MRNGAGFKSSVWSLIILRGLHSLLEFAMFCGTMESGRNPISLVRNVGATKRTRRTPSIATPKELFGVQVVHSR